MAASTVLMVLGGALFFPGVFYCTVYIQKRFFKDSIDEAIMYTVALRLVSTIQSVFACVCGFIIILSCKDVLYDRHWLASTYVWFGVTYFLYDAWAMYMAYWYRHPEIQSLPRARAVEIFMRKHALMMVHHLILPIIYLPIIVYYRRGVGDFFVGCFYCIELAIPCISLRAVLLQFGKEKTLLYTVNGIMLIVTFAACRVFIFPFMYSCFGTQKGLSLIQVIQTIPIKCNVGCLCLLLLQLYWLAQMIDVFVRTVWKRWLQPIKYPETAKSS